VVAKPKAMALHRPAEEVREGMEKTLTHYACPDKHHQQIHTNDPLERIVREIRRRGRVMDCSLMARVF
jgi:putative transposase